jgi:uncharacterized protein
MSAEISIKVRLTPRSGKNEIQRFANGVLLVRVTSPPVDGAANAALVSLLSGVMGVPKTSIRIASGQSAREKRVIVECPSPERIQAILDRYNPASLEGEKR